MVLSCSALRASRSIDTGIATIKVVLLFFHYFSISKLTVAR